MKTPTAITAYIHADLSDRPQIPDTTPGNYYVSALDPDTLKSWTMLGPFVNDHAAALAAVTPVASFCTSKDTTGRSAWYAFGTVRMADNFTQPGNANKYLPHLLQGNSKPRHRKTIAGIEFEALRETRPVPHWRPMVVATGYVYAAGRFKSTSKPKMWQSMEDTATRLGAERFAKDAMEAHFTLEQRIAARAAA